MRLNLLLTATLISLASSAVLLPRQDQAKLGTLCTNGAKNVCSMNLLAIVSTTTIPPNNLPRLTVPKMLVEMPKRYLGNQRRLPGGESPMSGDWLEKPSCCVS